MSYTREEFKTFDRITQDLASQDQMDRILARVNLNEFVKVHGKDKCDEMWKEIQENDGKVDK